MTEAIIVALITGLMTLAGNIIAMFQSSKLTAYKIEELRRDFADLREHVNKHNTLMERMAVMEQNIKSTNRRIDEIVATREHSDHGGE